MLEILKSPNGAIIAMEKVYSKIENRNFYKQNLGKDNISYLDSNLDIQIYKEKDFHDKLLYQSVEFMYRICFKCRDKLSLEDQIVIMKNINIIGIIYWNEHDCIRGCSITNISMFRKFSH